MTADLQPSPGRSFVEDFPILGRTIGRRRLIYLDNAATSLTPRQVVDAMSRYYLEIRASVHRSQHHLAQEAAALYEESRQEVARFLGCATDEVIFVRNTTDALNLVARGLGLAPAERVVVGFDAHHSNQLPWRQVGRVEPVRVDPRSGWDLDHYAELLRRRPAVVALTHMSNTTGVYLPLAQAATMARDAGATVVVDAAQSAPHRRLNVRELDVDFLAFSSHKMLGPMGVGVLYARRERARDLRPASLGGGMVDWVDPATFRVRRAPHGFEAGTPDVAGVLGMAEAIRYLDGVGWEELAAHDVALGRLLLAEAERRDGYLEVLGPPAAEERGGLLSVRLRDHRSVGRDVAAILSEGHGVMCRHGHLCAQPFVDAFSREGVLRASGYFYNSSGDVQAFFEALDEVAGHLS